jgi:signal transduction histidine kinase
VVSQVRRDGQTLRAEVVDNPIQYRGADARIAVIRDVTERERLEAQLHHAQKMEAVGMLAGGVAHDFNNLLGIVTGFTEAARDASAPGTELEADLGHVLDAAHRGAELTKKLLAFSRKQKLSVESLDLADVVVSFAGMLRRVLGADVVLEVIQADAQLPLMADRTQLEQVILNLVTNARQAMPHGGVITVTVSRLEADASFVAQNPWARVGTFAELRVTDRGDGMEPAVAGRMFEPFFTTKAEGTGLGLAIVHGIVRQHGGLLSVQTAPGAGTTFRVAFPLASVLSGSDSMRLGARAPRGTARLLVAEDEPQLRQITERSLSRLGYQVTVTSDGEEALQRFEQSPHAFDLVLLDVVMPRLGGREALNRMRSRRPELKALFMTGYAPESTGLTEVMQQPGLSLLRKPFTTLELARRVHQLLAG